MGKDKKKGEQLHIDIDIDETTHTESTDIGLQKGTTDKSNVSSADEVKKKAGEYAKAAGGMVGSLGKFAAKKGSELKDKLGDEEFQKKTISTVKTASSKASGTTTAAVKTATNIAKKAIPKKDISRESGSLTVEAESVDTEYFETIKPKKGVAASIERKKIEKAEKKAEKERIKKEAQQKSLKIGLLLMGFAILLSVGMYFLGGKEEASAPEETAVEETAVEPDTGIPEETAEEEPPVEAPVIGDDIDTIGDKVGFGEFDGKTISWWVCETQDGKSLIVATSPIAEMPFNKAVTADAVDWKMSTLRNFLNETFISEAFNDTERQCILETEFKGDDLTTQDKVFILNEEQYRKYSSLRNITFNGNCWLVDVISTTLTRQEENDIDRDGEIDYGLRNNEDCGVRPAMWVDTDTFKAINE